MTEGMLTEGGFTTGRWAFVGRQGVAAEAETAGAEGAEAAVLGPLIAVSFWMAATGGAFCLSLSFSLWSCCSDRSWVWSLGRVRWDLLHPEGCWCWGAGWGLACS